MNAHLLVKSRQGIVALASSTIILIMLFQFLTHSSSCFQLSKHQIDRINSNPKSTWKAKRYEKFDTKEWKDFINSLPIFDDGISSSLQARNGNNISTRRRNHVSIQENNKDIPLSFDAREKWPGCVVPASNVMQCSAIGTFTATDALSDRLCIASGGSFKEILSPQYMLNCDNPKQGCQGAAEIDVWSFLESNGTTTAKCVPFTSGENAQVGACVSECVDGTPLKRYKVKKGTMGTLDIITDMQRDILQYGSIQVGFKAYFDLFSYESGVYQHLENDMGSYFSGRVIGWGVAEDQTPYWICMIAFGPDWGNHGLFWMLRGADECGVESGAMSGQADISNI